MRTIRITPADLCTLVIPLLSLMVAPVYAEVPCQPVWTAVGSGVPAEGQVRSLTVFDDGSGPALYAGGVFETMDGLTVNHIAKWDGETWSSVGGGVSDGSWAATRVDCLKVADIGDGPALYAGGSFQYAGGVLVNGVAKWDGQQWSALGDGLTSIYDYVYDMCVYDDGSGPALCVGGRFDAAGDVYVGSLAKWDGNAWYDIGGGVMSDG